MGRCYPATMEKAHMARGFEEEGPAFECVIGLYHGRAAVKSGATTPTRVLLPGFGHGAKGYTGPR